MDSFVTYLLLAFGSLFSVLNPFAVIPPFVAMTQSNTASEKAEMITRACLVAAVILLGFVFLGLRILNLFGIGEPAFRIAGGLVLVRVAFDLLRGQSGKVTSEERHEGEDKDDISITPLGVPILCGPATLTTGILLRSEAGNWLQVVALVGVIAALYGGIFWLLRFTTRHTNLLGETTIKVASRLMGLLLVAIAVQFVIDGVRQANIFSA
jgi:multiple antibiotic resistance protein